MKRLGSRSLPMGERDRKLARLGKKLGLEFIRIFGSATQSFKTARDMDIGVGGRWLSLEKLAELSSELQKIFGKQIDLIQLRSGLPSLLVKEFAATSKPLWEKPKSGREAYAVLMDRLWAVAEDDQLSFPPKLRAESIRAVQRELDES